MVASGASVAMTNKPQMEPVNGARSFEERSVVFMSSWIRGNASPLRAALCQSAVRRLSKICQTRAARRRALEIVLVPLGMTKPE